MLHESPFRVDSHHGNQRLALQRANRTDYIAVAVAAIVRLRLRLETTAKYAGDVPDRAWRDRCLPVAGAHTSQHMTFAADANLTDSVTAARPAPNENFLLINAYTTHPQSPLLSVTRRIADSGCNLVDARLSTVGRDVSVTALAVGPWDAIAKLEAMLTRLEREEGFKLIWYRTGPKPLQSNLLPYVVEVVAADKPGILYQLADFFDRQGITIESLHCARYRAMQTGADMFSAQVTIGVPADMHIAGLRDDFLEFCDHLNLDAIMDPMKF
jgi:glycine cleavage system transcriptional repressor